MKPFLGIDLTTDKKNEVVNGDEFIAAKPSSTATQSLEHSAENAGEIIEKSKLKLPLRIGQCICGFVAVFVIAGIVKAAGGEDGVSLGQMYKNASWLFWLGGACLLAWGILKLTGMKREKSVFENRDTSDAIDDYVKAFETVFSEMSVPTDAIEVDILQFFYKVKDGNVKACEKGVQIARYINSCFVVFADSNKLYAANLEGKYEFPLSSLVSIRTVKKHIRIFGWNKEEELNKRFYEQYKITVDNNGCVNCRWYHILEISHNDEQWGIYFPSYELPVFEKLTGLKAE